MTATPAEVLSGAARWSVVQGDCRDVLATLPDRSVAHVITDPPYTQRTSNNARSAPDGKNGEKLHETKAFVTFDGIDGAEQALTTEFLRVARRWSVAFCAIEQIGMYAVAAGDCWVRGTVWLRTNSAPQFTGDRPGQAVEGVAIMHPKGKKRWNRGGHCLSFVGPTINAIRDPNRGKLGHPTPKPEWIMLEAIAAFTNPDDIILDPFAGSGTTGVAALRLGRRFIGIELDARYYAIALERLRAEESGSTLAASRAGQCALFAATAPAPRRRA